MTPQSVSTLLRAILGTHPSRAGEVFMDGAPYRSPDRNRGIVYQRYSLLPFLTAQQNTAFGLKLDQTSLAFRWFKFWEWSKLRQEHMRQAGELLDRVGLSAAKRQYPAELSGGMRKRVALARAVALAPNHAGARLRLAMHQAEAGNRTEAIAALNACSASSCRLGRRSRRCPCRYTARITSIRRMVRPPVSVVTRPSATGNIRQRVPTSPSPVSGTIPSR